jgi:hypothetical protein
MKKYAGAWLLILAVVCAGAEWAAFGKAGVRRRFFGVPPIEEAARTESRFVAVLLPRITAKPRKFAMSSSDLVEFLGGLKRAGYVSIGLGDVADLYARGRLLPPKAVLIAFAEDDPQGLELADDAMRSSRLRGTAFLTRTAAPEDGDARRFPTGHAVDQMRRGGTWDIGLISQAAPPSIPAAGKILAQLDDGGLSPAPKGSAYPLRFVASELGLDARGDDPSGLRVLALRPDRGPGENLRVVRGAWPRTAEFADDFNEAGLGSDWIAGWGVASRGDGRLTLLPTPRQSGAGVYLRGTENWRDVSLEFNLKKYKNEFWAYARSKPDGSFVRIGARGGYWYVEQKVGPALSTQLARSPILEGGVPARVRFVLKGDAAIVHVNGRMQFGRFLRLNPSVDEGRVLLGVYDGKSRGALAVLTSVRAVPLGEEWIAPKRGSSTVFDEERLEGLREEAVSARALSPRWVAVAPNGGVSVAETQGVLVRSLAGFYGCRLVPMAEFPASGPSVLANPASAAKALAGLTEAAGGLNAAGLNLRLRGGDVGRPETVAFLSNLREAFHARHWELWVTVDGVRASDLPLGGAVDGVLRPSERKRETLEILDAAPAAVATASRAQRETASIQ